MEEFGLKIDERNGNIVTAVSCRFCATFGREKKSNCTDDDDTQVPTLAESLNQLENQPKKSRKPTNHIKQWTSFRSDNFRTHNMEQHNAKFSEYTKVLKRFREEKSTLAAERGEPTPAADKFNSFFNTSYIPAFFPKESNKKTRTAVGKSIVEDIILGILFQSDDDDDYITKLAATKALFIPVRSGLEVETTTNYLVEVKNATQLSYVQELLSAGLSFSQCAKVVTISREKLGQVSKLGYVSRNDVSAMASITCALSLEMISELMRQAWTFSIGVDASTDSFGNSMLDVRIRIPILDDICNLHLLAIPMYESHSGESMFSLLNNCMTALDENWTSKVIGITTDGAASMTGTRSGLVSRLQSVTSPGLYRIWCGAHQLDLALKKSLKWLPDGFMDTLNTMISHMRRQQNLIASMKCKSPYYITVRWSSLKQVTAWYLKHKDRVMEYLVEKNVNWRPKDDWWLTLIVLDKFLELVVLTSKSLQGNTLTLSHQVQRLSRLVTELQSTIGATKAANTEVLSTDRIETENNIVNCGPFSVAWPCALDKIKSINLLSHTLYKRIDGEILHEIAENISKLFIGGIHSIASIVASRDDRNCSSQEESPPTQPLHFTAMSNIEFIELLSIQESRLRQSFDKEALEQTISAEFHQLLRLVAADTVFQQSLEKAAGNGLDFRKSWLPVGRRFPNLYKLASGLATVLPGTACVESDFSNINYERDEYRSALANISLEGILHARQFKTLQQVFVSTIE